MDVGFMSNAFRGTKGKTMKKFLALPMLLVLLLSGCSHGVSDVPADRSRAQADPAGLSRDTDAAFQTDSLSYTLVSTRYGLEGQVALVFTNPTSAAAYIVNCRGDTSLRLEKRVDDQWVPAWAPVVRECLSPPIVVQPGERHSGVLRVFGGFPSTNLHPQFVVDPIPGVYRIVWADVLRTYNDRAYPFGEPLPAEQRVSNRFELRVASR
jgi:hypothetical protein